MPLSKVNRNYQVTIPKDVRRKAGIERGDTVIVEYDESEGTVLVSPLNRGKRKTWALGKKLGVLEIESGVEKGASGRKVSGAVIGTNVLVFDIFEDAEFHKEASDGLDSIERWYLPDIVFHELMRFLGREILNFQKLGSR